MYESNRKSYNGIIKDIRKTESLRRIYNKERIKNERSIIISFIYKF